MANEDKKKPGERISKEEFEKLRTRYDSKNPHRTKRVVFHKESFERILSNPAVEHIAVYMGETDENTDTVMLIGMDSKSYLLYDTAEDKGRPCPPYC